MYGNRIIAGGEAKCYLKCCECIFSHSSMWLTYLSSWLSFTKSTTVQLKSLSVQFNVNPYSFLEYSLIVMLKKSYNFSELYSQSLRQLHKNSFDKICLYHNYFSHYSCILLFVTLCFLSCLSFTLLCFCMIFFIFIGINKLSWNFTYNSVCKQMLFHYFLARENPNGTELRLCLIYLKKK